MSDYIKKMSDALQAWKDCDKKRAFILLAMDGTSGDEGNEDSRSIKATLSGTNCDLSNILLCLMDENEDFREALKTAFRMGVERKNNKS